MASWSGVSEQTTGELVFRSLIGAALCFIACAGWDMHRLGSPQDAAERDPMLLWDFLKTPHAMIAPNTNAHDQIISCLDEILAKHGPQSIWVIPHVDTPSTNCVLLLLPKLTTKERANLKSLGASCVRRTDPANYWPGAVPVSSPGTIHEVLWD
jgi:hypothetical protein